MVATPLLYRTVNVERAMANPLFKFDTAGTSKVIVGKGGGRAKKGPAKARKVVARSAITPLTNLLDRFSFTKYLTLTTHYKSYCPPFPGLNMPNLTTLHICGCCFDLCLPEPPALLGRISGYGGRTSIKHPPTPTPCCPIVTNLRPSRLVFDGPSTSAMGLWPAAGRSFPPPWISELVVYYKVSIRYMRSDDIAAGVLGSIPDTIRKLSFVLYVDDEGWDNGMNGIILVGGLWVPTVIQTTPSGLWERVAGLSRGRAQVVEYIGVETIDTGDWQISTGVIMQEIRDSVKGRGIAAGWEMARAEARGEGIIFTSKEEYDRRQRE